MKHKPRIGKWGEETAVKYPAQRGCEIIEHSLRTPCGEIDLLGGKDEVFLFAEVKTRTSIPMGRPEEAITAGRAMSFRSRQSRAWIR